MTKQNGFSLIQVMIAGALVAGMGAAIMQLQKQSVSTTKTAEVKSNIEDLRRDFSREVFKKTNCTATFLGLELDSSVRDVSVIRKELSDGTLFDKFTTGQEFNTQGIKIKRMSYSQTPDELLKLTLEIEKTNDVTLGSKVVKKDFFLEYAKDSSNIITSCGDAPGGEISCRKIEKTCPGGGTGAAGTVPSCTTDPETDPEYAVMSGSCTDGNGSTNGQSWSCTPSFTSGWGGTRRYSATTATAFSCKVAFE